MLLETALSSTCMTSLGNSTTILTFNILQNDPISSQSVQLSKNIIHLEPQEQRHMTENA